MGKTARHGDSRLRLYMDDMLEKVNGGRKPSSTSLTFTTPENVTFLGGLPQQNINNLTGCISNVFIKRSIKGSRRGLAIGAPGSPARRSCHTLRAERPTSVAPPTATSDTILWWARSGPCESCQYRSPNPTDQWFFHSSHLSLELKINSSDGCVLHAAGRQHGGAAMSLSVLKGHLMLSMFLRLSAFHVTAGCGGFIGCFRDLKLNAVPAGNPLEVRPASDSGLLLYAGTSSDQFLSLVLSQGETSSFFLKRPLTTLSHCFSNYLGLLLLFCSPGDFLVAKHPDGFPAFHGCFRHVSINRRPVVLSKPLSVQGAVGTQGCPHM
ncbi:hypothetical protein XENOCAPTIV_012980 [Xenoophorus captivus]|uniref:Uncharacterized protein n=1 Tax=Xenoophorus captivus TaxID=1517983 RepID=A0ABV0SA55_9TELE